MTAEVSRMAVHSATVAWRKRGHSESGIRCRGSSSFRVILFAIKPVNSDRLKLTCAALLSHSTLPETSRLTNLLLPQHLWVRLSPHVFFIFRNRNRSPVSRFVNSRPPNGRRCVGGSSRTWLLGCLSPAGSSEDGACALRSCWFAEWTSASTCARRTCSPVVPVSCGVDQFWSRDPREVARWLRSLPRQHGVLLVDGQHLLAGRPHAPHPCRLGAPGNLGTQPSCHPVVGSGSQDLGTLPCLPVCTEAGCTSTEICACSPTHCLDVSRCTLLVQPTGHTSMEGSSSTP